MARKTIKVVMPSRQSDGLLALGAAVYNQATEPVNASKLEGPRQLIVDDPLAKANVDVAAIGSLQQQAAAMRAEAKTLIARAQSLNNQADTLLGVAPGQGTETSGTLLFHLTAARDALLLAFRGIEEKLSEYGFNVTLGTAAGRQAKKTP